jgi:uncharacterized membrane protein
MKFIRTTIAAGVLFLLPVTVTLVILGRVYMQVEKLLVPIIQHIPEQVGLFRLRILITILIMLTIFFIGGLLVRVSLFRKWVNALENQVLTFMPGYALLKTTTGEKLGSELEEKAQPILVKDNEHFRPAILVEIKGEWATIFYPEPPKYNTGEITLVRTDQIEYLSGNLSSTIKVMKRNGKGLLDLKK